MKKTLLFVLVFAALQVFAQNNDYHYRLSSVMSDDGLQTLDYSYDGLLGTNLLAIHNDDNVSEVKLIDSIYYEAPGLVSRLATHQFLNGAWLFANYVDYTYNEMGLRATRKNYNNFGGVFELGGTYYYYYDEEGKMTYWELDFFDMIFQRAEFAYDENNLLVQEIGYQDNYAGMEESWKLEYSYDENQLLIKIDEYYAVPGSWIPYSSKVYEYDEYGNCVKQMTMYGSTVAEMHEYEYDMDALAEDTYYFENPEGEFPLCPQMYHRLSVDKYHAMNDMNQLVYVGDYLYFYDEIYDAIEEESVVSSVYPNPVKDNITIESQEMNAVEVYDIYGRILYSRSSVSESITIDLSDYLTGIYFVKIYSETGTSVKKIMKD